MAAPYIATGVGMLTRNRFHLNVVDVPIPNLPTDLQGLRIAQITDIHLSPFLSERDFARAIDMANETKPHLTLVTGDLITRAGDPLDACLRQLARLRVESPVRDLPTLVRLTHEWVGRRNRVRIAAIDVEPQE